MREIAKKRLNLILIFLSLFIGNKCYINSNNIGIEILTCCLIGVLGLTIINQLIIKERLPFYIKNDSKFLIIYFLSLGILTIPLKLNLVYLLGIIIASFLFYVFLSKEYFNEKHISLIIFGLISLFINNYTYIIYTIILLLALFLGELIDKTAPFRKKNYLIIATTEILLGVFLVSNLHFIPFVLIFILLIKNKFKTKEFIKLSVFPVIIIMLLFLININLPVINSINSNDNFTNIIWITVYLLIIMSIINTIIENDENTVLKATLIIPLLGILIFPKENCYVISVLIPLSILLGNTMNKIPRLILKKTHIRNKHVEQSKPKFNISAVIPNYNYENYIEERIDSVLFQSYPVTELIVLDDVSKDNSVEVIEKKLKQVKKDYPQIKVKFIPNKVNSGNVFKQWKKCFEESSGDYLWICEADDSASPNFLETIMKFFEKDKDVVIAHSESLTMDENNNRLMQNLREWVDIFKTDKWQKDFIDNGDDFNKNYLVVNNTIANVSGVVFKKKKDIPFEKYLKTAENYKLAGDWYFYERVLDHGKIAYSKKSLNYHRMHSSSVTLTTKREKEYQEIRSIQKDIMERIKIPKKVLDRIDERNTKFKTSYGFSDEELKLDNISWDDINKKMDEKTMLSIIIPVYNTEPFLEKCLESVLTDLPPKSEIIIVNDGSPDNSEKIINSFKDKYPTVIKYFKKKNGGLSSAKNFGIDKAKGKYIGFLDSDDYIKPNMFSCMLKEAIIEDADIVYCDVEMVYEDGSYRYFRTTNEEMTDPLMQCLDNPLMPASWSKIVKKDLFKGLDYPVGYNNEDIAVSPILFARSKNTKTIPSPFYKYYQRSGSIQNSGFSEKRFVIFHTAHMCFERAKEFDKETQDKIKGSIYSHQLFSLLLYLIVDEKNYKNRLKYIKKFKTEINKFDDYQDNKYLIDFLKQNDRIKLLTMLKESDEKRIDLYLKTGF